MRNERSKKKGEKKYEKKILKLDGSFVQKHHFARCKLKALW